MYKILVVDDEEDMVSGLEMNLKREGYRVFTALEGSAALKIAVEENPHLMVLDIMMPGMSGLDVCREIRKKELDTRIIMLSARSEETDRVVGLELGADDYLAKPFSMRELQALIRARLRYRLAGSGNPVDTCRIGDVEIDFVRCRARQNRKLLSLTVREFDILGFLASRRGQVVTREQIMQKVWGSEIYMTPRAVDNHILRLRKKLEQDPANPKHILSMYGGGYKFVS